MDVDVGVVTYQTRDLTLGALDRLLQATAGLDARVLVQDNASTDGTADAIRRLHPSVEVEENSTNLGFGAATNQLIARSDAPWFLALNSDAWPEPGAIEQLLDVGARHPEAAAVAPRLERPDGTLEHSTFPFPSARVAVVTALGGYRRLWPRTSKRLALIGAWDHDEGRDVDWAVGAALLMRRAAIDAVGGFDERFFMYAEDLEWCWRANSAGWSIRFEPSAVVRHVGGASAEPAYGRDRTRAHVHNSYRFYRRSHGRAATMLYRTITIVGYARLYVLARLRRRRRESSEWATHLRAHLSRVGPRDRAPG